MGMSSCIHTLQGEDGDGGNIVLVITLSAFFFSVFIHFVITDVLHSGLIMLLTEIMLLVRDRVEIRSRSV